MEYSEATAIRRGARLIAGARIGTSLITVMFVILLIALVISTIASVF